MPHTPGPWDFDGCTDTGKPSGGDARYHQIDGPTPKGINPSFPYTVADTLNRHHCITPEEDAANARLISAAPELLTALKSALSTLDFAILKGVLECHGVREHALAAIAKAEGPR
jgi:hypothetical protein